MSQKVSVTLMLRRHVVEHLDELATVTGATREGVVESAIEDRFRERAFLGSAPCPWVITKRAIDAYRRFARRAGFPPDEEEARLTLEGIAVDAHRAEAEGRRKPVPQKNGTLRYRGPKPHRLALYVDPEGDRPHLVHVSGNTAGQGRG